MAQGDGDQRAVWALSAHLRAWYFGGYPYDTAVATHAGQSDAEHPGGMYLSTEARQAYTGVQESLKAILERPASPGGRALEVRTLDDGEYDAARVACSELRTELTADLLSRKRAFLVA